MPPQYNGPILQFFPFQKRLNSGPSPSHLQSILKQAQLWTVLRFAHQWDFKIESSCHVCRVCGKGPGLCITDFYWEQRWGMEDSVVAAGCAGIRSILCMFLLTKTHSSLMLTMAAPLKPGGSLSLCQGEEDMIHNCSASCPDTSILSVVLLY